MASSVSKLEGADSKKIFVPFRSTKHLGKKNSLANFLGCSRNVGLFYTQMMKEDDVSQVFYFIFFFHFSAFS